jgi:hypothetical protein
MRTALIDVQLGRHARFAERQVEEHAVFRRYRLIAIGVEQKRGRSLGGHLRLVGEILNQLRIGLGPQQILSRAWMAVGRLEGLLVRENLADAPLIGAIGNLHY